MSISSWADVRPIQIRSSGDGVRLVQMALRAAGHEVVCDGQFGPVTRSAVMDFQQAHGLVADGVVGPATAAALDAIQTSSVREPATLAHGHPQASVLGIAPWLSQARALTGVKEVSGCGDSPVILSWVREITAKYPDLAGTVGWYNHDSIPWCGLFAAICMVRSGFKPPKLALGAANWFTDWPDGYRLEHPSPGAVMVKSRAGGGHVTFYESEDDDHYFCRGGNQSDMVNVSAIRKDSSIRGFMWPQGGPVPGERKFSSIASARAGSEA